MNPGVAVGGGVGVVRGGVVCSRGVGRGEGGSWGRNRRWWKTGRSKKRHIIIATESKSIVVSDQGWKSTTS